MFLASDGVSDNLGASFAGEIFKLYFNKRQMRRARELEMASREMEGAASSASGGGR